jgi:hypothetical protein
VLAQLGSRVQHQLRAFTPDDAKALKATVSTYPASGYDLAQVLQSLATGEAIVTVMNEKGAPSPVAWTRLRAPQGSMAPTPTPTMEAAVHASPLLSTYGVDIDRESAYEILTAKLEAAALAVREADDAKARDEAAALAAKESAAKLKQDAAAEAAAAKERKKVQAEYERQQREFERAEKAQASKRTTTASTRARAKGSALDELLGSSASQKIVRDVVQGIFGTLRRR